MRILIVDDEAVSRSLMVRAVQKLGVEVLSAEDGMCAWQMICDDRLDIRLVVTDIMMPVMDGLDLVRRVRGTDHPRYVYIIMSTSLDTKKDIVEGFKAGADDYITKPFDNEELAHRVRVGQRILRLEAELAHRNAQLEKLALIDALTGVLNRRAFDERLAKQIEIAKRHDRPFALAMVDLDHFKFYNDTFGHAAGDWALQRVAEVLKRQVRGTDEVFRYGGEEFVCLLPDTAVEGAEVVGHRLCDAVVAERISHPQGVNGLITVSIGIACYLPGQTIEPEHVLVEADRALYRAKALGRNRIHVSDSSRAGVLDES